MARYFFHLLTGRTFSRDEEGVEIGTLDDVLAHAAVLARRLMEETCLAGSATRSAFAVEDCERRLILHLSFSSLDGFRLHKSGLDMSGLDTPCADASRPDPVPPTLH
ncbi:DUF6894 family protein [Methylobacterium planeticum]|uniref:DUF6894 domain-containing protein n=1 Tax=Methylobacterium planeticum TaxID=2615211 RepID=A0A6N6MS91_9HYPH|nr:hypothetical protein [Methylobacterium planeticum]KAB1073365.1 hypothetical protein F6X51_11445 [Methylobacterium planeticum]